MSSSKPNLSPLSDTQLEAIRGGMFGPFVNKPHNPADFAHKPPVAPRPPVTQGLGTAMAKGAVLGGLGGAATGNTGKGIIGGALLGGMDHCIDQMPPIGPSPVPTNLNIVSQVHPYSYGQVRQM
jgi:hypothetical protein